MTTTCRKKFWNSRAKLELELQDHIAGCLLRGSKFYIINFPHSRKRKKCQSRSRQYLCLLCVRVFVCACFQLSTASWGWAVWRRQQSRYWCNHGESSTCPWWPHYLWCCSQVSCIRQLCWRTMTNHRRRQILNRKDDYKMIYSQHHWRFRTTRSSSSTIQL